MAHITQQQLGPNDIHTTKNVLLVSITGDLDQASIEEDAESIQSIVDSAQAGTIIVFDFTNLLYINSRSISYLVNWYMNLEQAGAKLVLYGLRPNVIDILDTTGINRVIPIFTHFHEVKNAIEAGQIVTGVSETTLHPVNPSVPEQPNPNHMAINRIETAKPAENGNTRSQIPQKTEAPIPNGPLSIARDNAGSFAPTPTEPASKTPEIASDNPTENNMTIDREKQNTASPVENEPRLKINEPAQQSAPSQDTEEPDTASFTLLDD